jgi:hypothetical protein
MNPCPFRSEPSGRGRAEAQTDTLANPTVQRDTEGYLSGAYIESFAALGRSIRLAHSKGWVIARKVPGSGALDAMGPYPIFCCQHWDRLEEDLATLPPELASLTIVPDPFGEYTVEQLRGLFDVVHPHRARFIARLDEAPGRFVSGHHQKYAAKGLAMVEIERCQDPALHLVEWLALYGSTAERHAIHDFRAFSEAAFRAQLATPGLVMFRARLDGKTVAMHLWMTMGDVAYGHLAGHHPDAYRTHAPYALYWSALEWLRTRVRFVDLGSGTGGSSDGLAFFKRGWSNESRQGWICGRVVNDVLYRELTAGRTAVDSTYFPPYREPAVASRLTRGH